jgi:hypothetical protein
MIQRPSHNGHIAISRLIVALTRRCNALCDFCCNNDGPTKRGVLDPSAGEAWIADFADLLPDCRQAAFTGGEVFLYYDELLAFHRHLFAHGFTTTVTTNGYWGKDPDRAAERLLRLKALGLTGVVVSIDPSHARWVPVGHATKAVKVAIACGLQAKVTSNFNGPGGSAKDYFAPEWHDRIIWDENHQLMPVGRAKELTLIGPTEAPRDLFCPAVEPVIQPNGDVEPCCAVCLDDGVFVVGNVYQQPMSEILVNLLSDMYLKLITHRGMDELEAIVQSYHPAYRLPPRLHSVCFMCNALRQSDQFWMVNDALARYSQDLLIGRRGPAATIAPAPR